MTTEFKAQCNQLWLSIRLLKRQQRLSSIRDARQLLRGWLQEHPEFLASRDAGGELAMMEEALTLMEAEKVSEPVAA